MYTVCCSTIKSHFQLIARCAVCVLSHIALFINAFKQASVVWMYFTPHAKVKKQEINFQASKSAAFMFVIYLCSVNISWSSIGVCFVAAKEDKSLAQMRRNLSFLTPGRALLWWINCSISLQRALPSESKTSFLDLSFTQFIPADRSCGVCFIKSAWARTVILKCAADESFKLKLCKVLSAESMLQFQTSSGHFLWYKYANKLSREQGVIFLLIVASSRKGLTFTRSSL